MFRLNAPGFIDRGQTMYYNIYYYNWGDGNASNVVVSAVLPAEVRLGVCRPFSTDGTGSYDPSSRKVTWDLGDRGPLDVRLHVGRWSG